MIRRLPRFCPIDLGLTDYFRPMSGPSYAGARSQVEPKRSAPRDRNGDHRDLDVACRAPRRTAYHSQTILLAPASLYSRSARLVSGDRRSTSYHRALHRMGAVSPTPFHPL